jgi:hypothetical protein
VNLAIAHAQRAIPNRYYLRIAMTLESRQDIAGEIRDSLNWMRAMKRVTCNAAENCIGAADTRGLHHER